MKYTVPRPSEIFKINAEAPIEANVREVLCYTIRGKEDYCDNFGYPRMNFENDKHTHAKCVHIDTSVRYYIKIGDTGRIFNPIGLFDESKTLRESRHAGKPHWTWRPTSEEVFMLYLEFLKTKNPAHLLNAERKMV